MSDLFSETEEKTCKWWDSGDFEIGSQPDVQFSRFEEYELPHQCSTKVRFGLMF